jgi:hypothetical protein
MLRLEKEAFDAALKKLIEAPRTPLSKITAKKSTKPANTN